LRTKSFQSADGKVELYVESHPTAPDDSLEQFFNTKIQSRTSGGDRVQYSLVKNNWYVISGVNVKGFEFYEKFYYFIENGESWYVYWDLIYPHAQHKTYDALVAPIADGFIPNLPGEHGASTKSGESSAKASVVRVPFVGCRSDGQVGPSPAPKREDKAVFLDAVAAQRLAYYQSKSSEGVLAPRGWHCFGAYGSSGTSLAVTPDPIKFADLSAVDGPLIEVREQSGETSGRLAVAQVIARVFPTQKAFADGVIEAFPEVAFPFGPYPTDKFNLSQRASRRISNSP